MPVLIDQDRATPSDLLDLLESLTNAQRSTGLTYDEREHLRAEFDSTVAELIETVCGSRIWVVRVPADYGDQYESVQASGYEIGRSGTLKFLGTNGQVIVCCASGAWLRVFERAPFPVSTQPPKSLAEC
jgi:hypothetical protein